MDRFLTSKLFVRLLMLIATVMLLSLLTLSKYGLGDGEILLNNNAVQNDKPFHPYTTNSLEYFRQKEEEYEKQIAGLRLEIKKLKKSMQDMKEPAVIATSSNISSNPAISGTLYDCGRYIRKQVGLAEILHGMPLNNEYELIPFDHFTFTRVYPLQLGLGKRVVEKPIGYRRKDLLEAIGKALDNLNKNVMVKTHINYNGSFTLDDFIEGIYRHEPTTGTQYEMYFRTKQHGSNDVIKLIVMRPFAPLQTVQVLSPQLAEELRDSQEPIHIILPLAGRLNTFQSFMQNFVKISSAKAGKHLRLTVVYFGEEGLSSARSILKRALGKSFSKSHHQVLALNETFSRAKGLRVGAEHVKSRVNDALLFMCDVDVVFGFKFLNRCRWNTKPGKKVYYPVVFSLYNPHVVYTLQENKLPSVEEQLQITRDTGFWRDFGYGMTCQYRSDFLNIRGFDEEIVGWGGEDVMLYRKYVRSKIKIIRATDPDIFHMWHPKVCSGQENGQNLTMDQYKACIRSRALNEASHAQLGFLAFRDDIKAHSQQNNVPK